MNLNIEELTQSLSGYSSQANIMANSVANAVRPIGFILIGLFFLFEMMSWHQLAKSQGASLTTKMWIEISVKYIIAFFLVLSSGLICDALVEIINIIIKVIGKTASTTSAEVIQDPAKIKGWFEKMIFTLLSGAVNYIANIILGIIVFMRYLDLYMMKALAPLLVAFFMMDSLRSIAVNFLKYVAASAFIGVVLIVVSVVFDALISTDMLKTASPDENSWGIAFASIAKGVIYIFTIVGTGRKAKQLFGV